MPHLYQIFTFLTAFGSKKVDATSQINMERKVYDNFRQKKMFFSNRIMINDTIDLLALSFSILKLDCRSKQKWNRNVYILECSVIRRFMVMKWKLTMRLVPN
jgi:hypothetical protein